MQLTDLQNKVYLLTKTNSSQWGTSQTDLNAAINNAVERVAQLIDKSDSRWQWDDNNQTDLPVATTALVSGQQDYTLATTHLTIDRVELKDSASNWTLLAPIDQHDIADQPLTSYLGTSGIPLQYDKYGRTIMLYPTPNYSLSAALKIYFTRGPVTLSSGSDIPGFNSLFHDLICYWVAYEYALANGWANANGFFNAIQLKEQSIYDFYGMRSRDERPRMTLSSNATIGTRSGILGGGASDSNK